MDQGTTRTEHWRGLRDRFRACFCHQGKDGHLHPAGATVLANLRDMVKFERSPFSKDAGEMAYNVGQQDVVRHLIQMIELTDEQIARLDPVARDEPFNVEIFGSDGSNFR